MIIICKKNNSCKVGLVWFGLVWFYGISTIVGYLMPNPFVNLKTVLFQTLQFRISTNFSFSLSLDRTLLGSTTPSQGGPESNGNEGVLRVPQSSSITGASRSDCLVSYLGHMLGESKPFSEILSMYSATPECKMGIFETS